MPSEPHTNLPIEVKACRICGSHELRTILDLGDLYFTGIFPRPGEDTPRGPLELVRCAGAGDPCGLVQLRHSFDPGVLYGEGYGYRSSLNQSMVDHLGRHVAALRKRIELGPGDCVLDIGSNDGTLLSFYPGGGADLLGVDPTGQAFAKYYRPDIRLIPELFSAERVREELGERKLKIITSIAMLYDLRDPLGFMQEVASLLAEDGVWLFEQSYLPSMMEANGYDTICHEHIEYYGLRQICRMLDSCGLRALSVELNAVNGGSFAVTVGRVEGPHQSVPGQVAALLAEEERLGLSGPEPYQAFNDAVSAHRDQLVTTLRSLRARGKRVLGYGASTKGNVLLQYCGITTEDLPAIAEINEDKFGRVTPGTGIPIISEAEARASNPDVYLVLPWHFREPICRREASFLQAGGQLLFPLPRIETIT